MPDDNKISDAKRSTAGERDPFGLIIACASEAFGSAILVWVLGGVAISIASGFAGGMIPSPPPGFGSQENSDGHHPWHFGGWWRFERDGVFIPFFAIFFAHSLWVALRGRAPEMGRRPQRILNNLRENWFELIVGNAISAWVAALILSLIPNFSPVRMLCHWAFGLAVPYLQEIGRFLFGEPNTASLGNWFSWYGDNQAKLNFWIIYLAGAFDDLGVPNFKTLARWTWRRIQKRRTAPAPMLENTPVPLPSPEKDS